MPRGYRSIDENNSIPWKTILAILVAAFLVTTKCGEFNEEAPNPFEHLPPATSVDKKGEQDWSNRIAAYLKTNQDFKRNHAKNLEVDSKTWATAIVKSAQKVGMKLDEDNFKAVIVVLDVESDFLVNPPIPGGMDGKYGRYMKDIENKLESYGLPDDLGKKLKTWIGEFEEKYGGRLKNSKTELELDKALQTIREELHAVLMPVRIMGSGNKEAKKILAEVDDKLHVATMGSMQVNATRAEEYFESRYGKDLTKEEVRDRLFTLEGGIEAGAALLNLSLRAYKAPDKVQYAFADYHAGPYSSRNAGFQAMVVALSGEDLNQDGDCLSYQAGEILPVITQTEEATWKWLKSTDITYNEVYYAFCYRDETSRFGMFCIRDMFKAEKTADFTNTDVFRRVKAAYGQKTKGPAILAKIPEAQTDSEKWNKSFTTEKYVENDMEKFEAIKL